MRKTLVPMGNIPPMAHVNRDPSKSLLPNVAPMASARAVACTVKERIYRN
jgi:hypothetical protein